MYYIKVKQTTGIEKQDTFVLSTIYFISEFL